MTTLQLQQEGFQETETLAPAVKELTEVAQSLAASAQQMMQIMQFQLQAAHQDGSTSSGAASPAATRINVWEDDPFSEKDATQNPAQADLIRVPVPQNNQNLLQFHITDPAVSAGLYNPGTAGFRYWEATEALTRAINFWGPLLPNGTVWSALVSPLQVHLIAGQDFNANYSRQAGLRFYRGQVQGKQYFSAESPDVSCHELGHGILDAVRPELFNAASAEVAAFHEGFADAAAILSALQVPSLRTKVLAETGGRLNVNSRLSRLAEQLGWAIRQLSPTAVDADCLRNAANRFFYVDPDTLPPSAPSSQLASEAHSFSRVFSGAFLDALARMLPVLGAPTDQTLLEVSKHMGQLLIDGVRLAPITTSYYSQVAAGMIQAGKTRYNDQYRAALTSGFVQHGILAPSATMALQAGPVPQMVGMAGNQTPTLGAESPGYRMAGESAPDLPTRSITTTVGLAIDVHAPSEPQRFGVAPATLGIVSQTDHSPDREAQEFVEDLIQRGQIELESTETNLVSSKTSTADDREASKRTHKLVAGVNGRMVLKRLHFNCGCSGCCRSR